MITLFDYPKSSAAYRLRIALNMLGLEYNSIPVDLLSGAQKSPENLARNPQGLVPTLEIDGLTLTNSLAILDYLEETRGPFMLPESPAKRAEIRAVAQAIAVDIHPVLNLSVAQKVNAITDGNTPLKDWMHAFMPDRLAAVETMLAKTDGPYAFGRNVTLADICLMPQLYNARRWEVDLSAMPRLTSIEAELSKLPAFADAHPDRGVAPT